MRAEPVVYRAGLTGSGRAADADPITTEVIRHGLNSAAEAIKRTLIRTSMSPVIYEVLDFAAVLYDRQMRLLAQAPSLPFFMGTMSFCIESAVEEVGGEAELEPGDIILLNNPYQTGSHPQDAAVVMPIFLPEGELIGYSAIKAHWLDIGAKEIYCTDTTDVFQEGTIFPGVKLYSRGELVKDIMKMATANSRLPKMVVGDINAEVAGVRAGAAGARAARAALRPRDVRQLRRADVRPRRGGRAQLLSSRSPTAATSGAARWTTTASRATRSRSRSCSRSTARRPGSTSRTLPTRSRGRSTARSPRRSRRRGWS